MRVLFAACTLCVFGALNHEVCHAVHGIVKADPSSIGTTIDDAVAFMEHHSGGMDSHDEKPQLIEAAQLVTPGTAAIEFGSMCGYSTLRLLKDLPTGSSLVTLDPNNDDELVQELLTAVGHVSQRTVKSLYPMNSIDVLLDDSNQGNYNSPQAVTLRATGPYGFVYMDYPENYVPGDLQKLEQMNLLTDGAIVVISRSHDEEYEEWYPAFIKSKVDTGHYTHVNSGNLNDAAAILRYSTSRRLQSDL